MSYDLQAFGDGVMVALNATSGDDRVFGRRFRVTVEWLDPMPDAMLIRLARAGAEATGRHLKAIDELTGVRPGAPEEHR